MLSLFLCVYHTFFVYSYFCKSSRSGWTLPPGSQLAVLRCRAVYTAVAQKVFCYLSYVCHWPALALKRGLKPHLASSRGSRAVCLVSGCPAWALGLPEVGTEHRGDLRHTCTEQWGQAGSQGPFCPGALSSAPGGAAAPSTGRASGGARLGGGGSSSVCGGQSRTPVHTALFLYFSFSCSSLHPVTSFILQSWGPLKERQAVRSYFLVEKGRREICFRIA